MKQPVRILPYVLWRVLPVGTFILIVIWYTVTFVTSRTVKLQVQERLVSQAVYTANITAQQLNTLVNAVKSIAGNTLIINGVIDTQGRVHYVPPGHVGQKGVVTKSVTNQEIERNAGVE